jgi:RNA-directed DNA polymerase
VAPGRDSPGVDSEGGRRAARVRDSAWLRGWHQFFGIASLREQYTLRALDAHIRRRLRAIVLRHWKRRRTTAHNLIALGIKRRSGWGAVYGGRRSVWALSDTYAVDHAMPVRFFTERGLARLVEMDRDAHQYVVAPVKPQLELEWE